MRNQDSDQPSSSQASSEFQQGSEASGSIPAAANQLASQFHPDAQPQSDQQQLLPRAQNGPTPFASTSTSVARLGSRELVAQGSSSFANNLGNQEEIQDPGPSQPNRSGSSFRITLACNNLRYLSNREDSGERTVSEPETPRSQRAAHRERVRQRQQPASESPTRGLSAFDAYNIFNMANQQGKWREDQVLIICPGSQTTMAQLGCSELTLPTHRIPTRMFKDVESNEFTPYHTYKRKKTNASGDGKAEDEWEFVEDRDSVEGAIYPIRRGRITNMPAFLAFLDHVHGLITNTYHNTPIVLMASPTWTRPNCEAIARYIFEKTKTPALCLVNSAVAAQYGIKGATMTVVDIGFEQVDVTCIYDYLTVSHKNLGWSSEDREISGGEVFTKNLLSLLKDNKFNYDMAEQLKKSSLCEVLPYAPEFPEHMELPTNDIAPVVGQGNNPTSSSAEGTKPVEPPKPATALGGETENGIAEGKENEEGVLDVANIVTSGNTREFLAKKEKEKTEKAKSKKQGKAQEAEAAAAKPARLPNSKRKTNVFHYEELVHEDVEVTVSNGAPKPTTANGDAPTVDGAGNNQVAKPEAGGEVTESTVSVTNTERRTKRVRRDIEIGLERFLFADRRQINRISDTIYQTIQAINETYKRTGCWDNILFVGNGARLRGLKENIMQTLTVRHLISPSTATIFTSELPSNMATPTGTGAQTPTGSYTGQLPTTSSVNPLLQAATTASLGVPGATQAAGSAAGDGFGSGHHSHGQTPTSIKQAPLPTYLAEWTKSGWEESMFLGSLIVARLAFCIHHTDVQSLESVRLMSLTRIDYNERGPKLIHNHNMLGAS